MKIEYSVFCLLVGIFLLLGTGVSAQDPKQLDPVINQMDNKAQLNKGSTDIPGNSLIGLQTTFGGSTLPEGWQITELGEPGYTWTLQSNLIWINSYQNEGHHVAGELISPAIDCSQMDLVLLDLNLNYFFYPFPAGVTDAEIRYSTDGVTWQTFYTFTSSMGGTGGDAEQFDLSEVAAGESEFYLKFWFDDQDYLRAFWQIFSVAVYCPVLPEFSVEPAVTNLDFGTILLGETSIPQSITIKNTGNGELIVNSPQVNNNTHFSLIYNQADFPAHLEFEESVDFQIVFHPQQGGNLEAQVNFTYVDVEQEQYIITLTGQGDDPTVNNFPWTENFNDFYFPSHGWNYVQGIVGSYWQSSGTESFPDGRSVRSIFGPSSNYQANEWLLSPPLNLDHPNAELLYFYVLSNFEPDSITNKLQVWILSEKYDNVQDLENNGEMIAEVFVNDVWERRSVDISAYNGMKYIAFRYKVNVTGGWRLVYVDNLNIEQKTTYTLTMLEPNGGGIVTPEPGQHSYYGGEEVTLVADTKYNWGWQFQKWEVNGVFYSDEPQTTIVLDANTQVKAFFVPVSPVVLTMNTTSGSGTTMPKVGTHLYVQGAILSVMAYPEPGWEFSHWKKDGVQFSTQNPMIITLEEALTLQAVFQAGSNYSINFNVMDDFGNPLSNAQICLNDILNPEGIYSFNNLQTGTYYYSITAEGYIPTGGELRIVNQNITTDINLVSQYGPGFSATFTVTDIDNTPINDAVIKINGYAGLPGTYTLTGFSIGTYTFQVEHSGYLTYEGELTIQSQNINVEVVLSDDNLLFRELFDNNIQPGGWHMVIHGEDNRTWEFNNKSTVINPNENHIVSASLVSPAISVADAEAISLRLKHFYNPYERTKGEIRISEDGFNWHTAKSFSTSPEGEFIMYDIDYYLTQNFDFDETVYIAFYYSAINTNSYNYYNWKIDNLVLFSPESFAFEASRASAHLYVPTEQSAEFKLRIQNIGGLPDVYNLQKIKGGLSYTIPSAVELEGGQTSVTNISFTMPQGLNMGVRDTLIVRITSQSQPQLTEEVMFINASIAPINGDYFEDFDIVTIPEIPGGWSKVVNSTSGNAKVSTVSNFGAHSNQNHAYLYNSSDPNADLILILPTLAEGRSLSEFRTRLWLKNGTSSPLIVGTMDHPQGTFTPLTQWVSNNHYTWQEFMYGFEGYQGTDKYVAFKQNTLDVERNIQIDDITIEVIPPPIFNISQTSHNFGEGWVNYNNDSIEVTITNKGHYELFVNDVRLSTNRNFMLQVPQLPAALEFNETVVFKVFFHPQDLGQIVNSVLIDYIAATQSVFTFNLQGQSLPRPQGSICEDPIPVDLPLINYAGNTEQYGRDYFEQYVSPPNYFLDGNDLVMQFTLDVPSLLSGSIEGNAAGYFVLETCPNLNNPAQIRAMALDYPGYESFQNIIVDAGTYFLVVSSAQFNPPFYTDFILNLSSAPLPDYQMVNFTVMEDSEDQQPLEGVRIYLEGDYMSGNIYTDNNGQVSANMIEGLYYGRAFLWGYLEKEIEFSVDGETVVNIYLQDLKFNPSNLNVNTENQNPGEAFFTWNEFPAGEPWVQGFEEDFPPTGWSQIINNPGGLDPVLDGADWKFTWQQYDTVYFINQPAIPVEGHKQAFVHWSTTSQDEWLITHQFKAPADQLEFWYFGKNGSPYQEFYVKISNDNGQTWTPLWNASDLPSGYNHYEYPVFIDLSYYADQDVRLAWNAVGPNGLESSFLIDGIKVGSMKIDTDDLVMVSKSQSVQREYTDKLAAFPGQTASSRSLTTVPRVKEEDMFMPRNSKNNRTSTGFDVFLNDMNTPIAVDVQETQYLFEQLLEGEYIAGVRAVYTTGESDIVTIPFSITEGYPVSVNDLNHNLSIFPNPAAEWVTVKSEQIIDHCRLINSKGEIISSQIVNSNSTNISVLHLPAGFYILQVYSIKGQMNHAIQVLR